MLELTQQSLAFQQERSQLTDMLHAQHESMQQLVEETQTQEAALQALSQHAQDADQQVFPYLLLLSFPQASMRLTIRAKLHSLKSPTADTLDLQQPSLLA